MRVRDEKGQRRVDQVSRRPLLRESGEGWRLRVEPESLELRYAVRAVHGIRVGLGNVESGHLIFCEQPFVYDRTNGADCTLYCGLSSNRAGRGRHCHLQLRPSHD